MGKLDLRRFENPAELAQAAAWDWLELVSQRRSPETQLMTALSGGRVAGLFFSSITSQAKTARTWLSSVHFFWSDERCVPPADPESNFRLAKQALLDPLGVADDQIHRIQGELPPQSAANGAEEELRRVVSRTIDDQPCLDLVLLGMGEDGHVASLFPEEPERFVLDHAVFRPVSASKPPPMRITMGYRAIVAARQVWVLASGAAKENALHRSLDPAGSTPLARVIKQRSSTTIYSDIRVSNSV